MKILAVDIGTGTQDIFLYNSKLDLENNFKLVVPSATMLVRQQVNQATKNKLPVLLTGFTMGGGPSAWAVEAHLRQGLAVYATPQAARTLNDDLEVIQQMGIVVVGEDEAKRLPDSVRRIEMCDFDYPSIMRAFESFGVALDDLSAVVVGVFDHGDAPPHVSDRQFRFDYLDERIRALNRLSAFAYRAEDVPATMTRMQAVASSAKGVDIPLVVMDTAPAAVLGATQDSKVAARESVLVMNVGNFHTLAFRLGSGGIEGLFEHHTGLVDVTKLEALLLALANGTLRREDVFNDQGHGALVYNPTPLRFGDGDYDVVVTGPRRNLFAPPRTGKGKLTLRAYFAAPFGDMMITGCFGLLAATADVIPSLAEPIRASLHTKGGFDHAPWDIE